MVDADSIQEVGDLRVADIMTVYAAPRTNTHGILLDRHVQRTGFDCAARTFVGILTIGYLGEKRVGSSPETVNWQSKMAPLENDALTNRVYTVVCSPSPRGNVSKRNGDR